MKKVILSVVGIAVLAVGVYAISLMGTPTMKINPGPVSGKVFLRDNARGTVWCEIVPLTLNWADTRMDIYNSSSVDECTEERSAKLDLGQLASELKVPKVVLNPGRYWMLDRATAFSAGEVVDFHGIKAQWAAHMTPIAVAKILGTKPYLPVKITRDTEWLFLKDKPVYLLRTPEGVVWVLQVFSKLKDPTLSVETMDQLGAKIKLPEGWEFEVKVIDQDLSLQPRMSGGDAYIMRDELGNTYMACGMDKSCNFTP